MPTRRLCEAKVSRTLIVCRVLRHMHGGAIVVAVPLVSRCPPSCFTRATRTGACGSVSGRLVASRNRTFRRAVHEPAKRMSVPRVSLLSLGVARVPLSIGFTACIPSKAQRSSIHASTYDPFAMRLLSLLFLSTEDTCFSRNVGGAAATTVLRTVPPSPQQRAPPPPLAATAVEPAAGWSPPPLHPAAGGWFLTRITGEHSDGRFALVWVATRRHRAQEVSGGTLSYSNGPHPFAPALPRGNSRGPGG